MNPKAIIAVEEQVERAREAVIALNELHNPRVDYDYKAIERQWGSFLEAYYTIWVKLERGSQGFQKTEPWFGGKLRERRKDELLAYLYQARNSATHGLEGITKRQILAKPRPPDAPPIRVITNNPNITFRIRIPGVFLVPVTDDRFGTVYDTPKKHLGEDFKSLRPHDAAGKGLAYLEALVAEAKKRAQS